MYVISLVTERDVVKGKKYQVTSESGTYVGKVYVIDDVGDEWPLDQGNWVEVEGEMDILRERIEALQEENAELKFRLDSLEK